MAASTSQRAAWHQNQHHCQQALLRVRHGVDHGVPLTRVGGAGRCFGIFALEWGLRMLVMDNYLFSLFWGLDFVATVASSLLLCLFAVACSLLRLLAPNSCCSESSGLLPSHAASAASDRKFRDHFLALCPFLTTFALSLT